MNKDIAEKFSKVAQRARQKANYLRQRPINQDRWNYEQEQGGAEALEDVAKEIETLVAAYFIHFGMQNNRPLLNVISRQCRSAIRREIRRQEVEHEYAELL